MVSRNGPFQASAAMIDVLNNIFLEENFTHFVGGRERLIIVDAYERLLIWNEALLRSGAVVHRVRVRVKFGVVVGIGLHQRQVLPLTLDKLAAVGFFVTQGHWGFVLIRMEIKNELFIITLDFLKVLLWLLINSPHHLRWCRFKLKPFLWGLLAYAFEVNDDMLRLAVRFLERHLRCELSGLWAIIVLKVWQSWLRRRLLLRSLIVKYRCSGWLPIRSWLSVIFARCFYSSIEQSVDLPLPNPTLALPRSVEYLGGLFFVSCIDRENPELEDSTGIGVGETRH